MHRTALVPSHHVAWWGSSFILHAFLAGCGGDVRISPVDIDSGPGPDADSDADATSDVHVDAGPSDPCRTADGVRLCGGPCPTLERDQCRGVGCQQLRERVSGAPTGIGVCVPDLPVPIRHCGRCLDGDVCANVSGEGTICVPEALCERLHALGLASACRYADFTPYDGRPVAVARGAECPRYACGPGCGGIRCADVGSTCSGRSATHGYGYCFASLLPTPCDPSKPLPRACAGDACIAWASGIPGDTTALAYGTCDYQFEECSNPDRRLVCTMQ